MLSLDGQPAAMEYQLSYKGNVSALRADYDLSYEDMSLGTYLNWKLLQQLFTSDLQYYSMGPGDNAYKRRWAEDYPPLYRIVGFNNTIRGLMLRLLQSKFKRLVNRTKSLLNQTK
jgi:CelD/BcsL family acetyltransferase involved in cellulose biosynthesis